MAPMVLDTRKPKHFLSHQMLPDPIKKKAFLLPFLVIHYMDIRMKIIMARHYNI